MWPWSGSQMRAIQEASEESEKHVHNFERWLGLSAAPGAGRVAAVNLSSFRVTTGAAANGFGDAVQLLGVSDTPQQTGKTHFDLHRIHITNVETNALTYRLRIAFALSGESSYAAAVANGHYTEVCFKVDQTNADSTPVPIMSEYCPVGIKAWAAVAHAAADAKWVEFLFGIHEYD